MDTDDRTSCISEIGERAGQVWHILEQQGPMSLTKLLKVVEAPRDSVMQAVGWLAREGKIALDATPRGRVIALR
jgi:hypothetical protein